MSTRPVPEWFTYTEAATTEIMSRVADAVSKIEMSPQVKSLPMLAHWFVLDSLLLSNQANRDGMHANALALTRQCVEGIGVIEIGVCGHPAAEAALLRWEADSLTPGKLRAWLQDNVWPLYGTGLWTEPWSTFMREFAAAIQPYAHYSSPLAQWQYRFHGSPVSSQKDSGESRQGERQAVIEIAPRAYDSQKATRVTLFHALVTYILGRIVLAAYPADVEFGRLMTSFGAALGKSRYLDGHETDWSQQLWAMVWERGGGTILE